MSSPEVEQLAKDYAQKNVEVISLSLDDSDEPVRDFVQAHHITTRVALVGASGTDIRYRVRGIPAFFIIDKEGNVVDAWQGFHPSFSTVWREELNRLLKV